MRCAGDHVRKYCRTVFGFHVERDCFNLGKVLNMPLRYWQIREFPPMDIVFPGASQILANADLATLRLL